MSRILRVLLIPVIVAAVPVFSSASQPPELPGDSVSRLADEYLEAYLERYPEVATDFGIPGLTHDRLTDISREATSAWQGREDAWLERLGNLGVDAPVGSPDWAIAGLLRETLEGSIAFRVCRDELWSVSQTAGWQTYLPHILKVQPLGDDELRRQAVARARALVGYLEASVANLKGGLRPGYSSPRRNVELTLEQLRRLNAADSPLASPLERDEDPTFKASYSRALQEEVHPALGRYIAFLEDEYLPAAREEIPVAANPHGLECYRAAVRHHSTLDLPAEEIHELGLQQMAGILEEMRVIGARSFGTEDVPSLLNRVTTEQEFTFSTREEIIAFSEAAYARARDAMPRFFGRVPKAEVVIEPYPAFLEATGTGEYWPPAEDGSTVPVPTTFRLQIRASARSQSTSHSPSTRPFPATICSWRSRSSWETTLIPWRATCTTRDTARAGACMRNGWRTRWVCTAPTSPAWECWGTRPPARPVWSSTPASTRWAGRDNERSTT